MGQKKQVVLAFQSGLHIPTCTQFFRKHIIPGYTLVTTPSVVDDINKLLSKENLGPLTDFQVRTGTFYGKYASTSNPDRPSKLVAVVCTTNAMLGSPFKIAVSVDWACDISKSHFVFHMIELLKNNISKRKQKSYLFTQSSLKKKAIEFWKGRLTHSKLANIMVGIFHLHNPEYLIYEDVTNMVM